MNTEQQVIEQTACWVKTVIVALNFCPFAKRELDRGRIRYHVIVETEIEVCLQAVIAECVHLDSHSETETSLLIFPHAVAGFVDYLQLVALAEKLLRRQGYEGIYQLASFHPEYCFADAATDDAANYTNRSPYPMLHLIREASLERALQKYVEPERIPERNIEFARSKGLAKMQDSLNACLKLK